MEKFELIFIPSPGLSHLTATVEATKLLLDRDPRLSVTVLTMQLPNDTAVDAYTANFSASPRLTFSALPPQSKAFMLDLIDSQITNVRHAIDQRRRGRRIAGIVLDIFCLKFVDVAREFGFPAYCFFTSGAGTLGLFQYLLSLKFDEEKELSEFKNSGEELPVPCFSLPVPAKVLPAVLIAGGPIADHFLNILRRIPEMEGVVVNTFHEFESYAIDSMAGKNPRIYPVGPILDLAGVSREDDVKRWLDDQPEKSVVFLCFGTNGKNHRRKMEKFELIFIPSPGLSHLTATVEATKLLLDRDPRLSVTVLTMQLPNDTAVDAYTANFSASPRLTFSALPPQSKAFMLDLIDSQITNVRHAIDQRRRGRRIAGIVLDIFCLKFVDVAREFGFPAYCFFTSGAGTLGLFQYLLSLKFDEEKELSEFKNSGEELPVPCFSLPVPAKVLPAVLIAGGPIADHFLNILRRIPEMEGVVVNTFHEFESYAIDSMAGKNPRIYPVGPILDLAGVSREDDVKRWLDDQPEKSVVFLCFGTNGSFSGEQVKEIALALENSECRFLWSLRKPVSEGVEKVVVEYEDFGEVLPEGFLERTKGVGRVVGWVGQVGVLAHRAVGGFVSHCGWNSTLESVWFGVPMATFPLYAEQQLNAFYLVKELGMAEMIRLDYKTDFRGEEEVEIVGAGEIEGAIRRLMTAEGGGVRGKVEEMGRKGRAALEIGGSSYKAQVEFIEDVIRKVG
ncbi:putative UDP-glucose flavonoid 3-O-glucosyltransferase 3 [Salvia hispanica]|uniref:putative UDP-glucose flavonoid 3-O-glucosyltransferase 3 n=1 Tax=Salvia hispanica TaxID=49212 RepID=UPI0020091C58|nr:putative UDP-glucose flavonoid 3-O-glucosyltransferase 3 [Salvia hispanica]